MVPPRRLQHTRLVLVVALLAIILGTALAARAYTAALSSCADLPMQEVTVSEGSPSVETSRWCRNSLELPVQEILRGGIAVETPSPGEIAPLP